MSRLILFITQAIISILIIIIGAALLFTRKEEGIVALGVSLITFVGGSWMPTPKRPKDDEYLMSDVKDTQISRKKVKEIVP